MIHQLYEPDFYNEYRIEYKDLEDEDDTWFFWKTFATIEEAKEEIENTDRCFQYRVLLRQIYESDITNIVMAKTIE